MKSVILSEKLGPVLLFYKDDIAIKKLKNSIINNNFNKLTNNFDNILNKINNEKDRIKYSIFISKIDKLDPFDFFDYYFDFINLEYELENPNLITINTYNYINGLTIYNDLIERKNIKNFTIYDLIFVKINDRRLSDQLRDL